MIARRAARPHLPRLATPPGATLPSSRPILGLRVDALTYASATERILAWARDREGAERSRYVCVATVHMVMEGHDDPEFQRIVNAADLVTSDGMPLVWGLRLQGLTAAERVYGPDLTLALCAAAAEAAVPVGFYGSNDAVLDAMVTSLRRRFPALRVVYRHSPPFRPLTAEERSRERDEMCASGARILFVGLGCPKQERWMATQRGELDAVLVGVGAAFDFIAGSKRRAPARLQRLGLEWLFRLVSEPRRLWRRYLYHNPRFVLLFARQLLTSSRAPDPAPSVSEDLPGVDA